MPVPIALRLQRIPPYPFEEIAKIKAKKLAQGAKLVDLGIGDPDLPTPPHIVEALCEAAHDPSTHAYDESGFGLPAFREAVAQWYRSRFGVALDPGCEIQSLIGSKEGIAHIFLAYLNPGDYSLVPDPRYMVYSTGTMFAGGSYYQMPLDAQRGYLPDLAAIPPDVARNARLLFLNYPNNPTGAVAPLGFFNEVVEFGHRNNVLVCHDCAYSEVAYDGLRVPSILQAEGAKEVCIEFHSLSKTYNMTGWRVGFAVGNKEAIAALSKVKTNVDSGVFMAVQRAAIAALTGPQDCVKQMQAAYQERRDRLVPGLNALGWQVPKPKATFYVWAPVLGGLASADFAARLLDQGNVLLIPGSLYGSHGEGFVRMSLTIKGPEKTDLIEQALTGIGQVLRGL
jgi:LL-diaminopimelate aminotransferase